MQLLPPAVVRGNRASCGASSEADSAAAMTPCSLLDSAMIDSRASGGHMWNEVAPAWIRTHTHIIHRPVRVACCHLAQYGLTCSSLCCTSLAIT